MPISNLKRVPKHKNYSISSYLRESKDNSNTNYSLWKAAKRLKIPTIYTRPIKLEDGNWARSNKQEAETFATCLENIFKPYDDQENEQRWIEPNQTE